MKRWRGGSRSESGVAMVEFAIVLPLMLMLFVGVVEFGFAFKEKLLVSNAVQTATRTGSSLGQNSGADSAILESIQQGFSGLPNGGTGLVTKVTIYKANSSGNPVSGSINTYLFDPGGATGCDWNPCGTSESNLGGPWLPSTRNVDIGTLDNLGVTIYYGHNWIIGGYGFLPDLPCNTDGTQCWQESAVLRLEPVNL